MENIEKLKEKIEPVLKSCGVTLYELKWTGGKDRILQAAIEKPGGEVDLDTCAAVSEKLSGLLDSCEIQDSEYTLEVCSPGAEREIKDLQNLKQMNGSYVLLRLKHPFKEKTELTGTVIGSTEESVTMEYRDKAAVRHTEIEWNQIQSARMAVKF